MAERRLSANARDFDFGLESGGLQSLAAGLAARDIRFDLLDKGEMPGEGGKATA